MQDGRGSPVAAACHRRAITLNLNNPAPPQQVQTGATRQLPWLLRAFLFGHTDEPIAEDRRYEPSVWVRDSRGIFPSVFLPGSSRMEGRAFSLFFSLIFLKHGILGDAQCKAVIRHEATFPEGPSGCWCHRYRTVPGFGKPEGSEPTVGRFFSGSFPFSFPSLRTKDLPDFWTHPNLP